MSATPYPIYLLTIYSLFQAGSLLSRVGWVVLFRFKASLSSTGTWLPTGTELGNYLSTRANFRNLKAQQQYLIATFVKKMLPVGDLIIHKKLNTVKKYLFEDYLLQDHVILVHLIASFSIVKQHVKEPVLAINAKIVKKYSCDMGKN